MESIYQDFFDFMSGNHGLTLTQTEMNDIMQEALKLHSEIEQQEYNDNMAAAIDDSGGCSRCMDLDGYSCICEDEDEPEDDQCDYCQGSGYNPYPNHSPTPDPCPECS